MARVRWTGDGGRQVPVEVDGRREEVDAPRMEWVDVPAGVARSLNQQDGWELEATVKAKRTRKQSAKEQAVSAPSPAEVIPAPSPDTAGSDVTIEREGEDT